MMIRLKNRQHSGGYSLTELLVVVGMIGVISLVTVPQFMTMYRSAKIKSSLRAFTGDVRAARTRAVTKNRMVRVALCNAASGCDVSAITPAIAFPPIPADRPADSLLNREYIVLENTTGTTWVPIPAGQPLGGVRQMEDSVYFGNVTFPNYVATDDNLLDITFLVNGTIQQSEDPEVWPKTIVIRTDSEIAKPVISISFNKTGQLQAQN